MRGLLLIALSLLLTFPHQTSAQEALDCSWAGTWLISYTILQQWNNPQGGGLAVSLATETGAATIEAVCSESPLSFTGEASGSIGIYDAQGQVCGAEYTAPLSGTIDVSGAFPTFNLHFVSFGGSSVCYFKEVATQGMGRILHLATSSIDEGYVYEGESGSISYNDPQAAAAVSGFLDIGGSIDIDFITDAYRYPHPEVIDAASRYRRYFLQTVPLLNRFTTTIDWDHSPEPSAELRIHDDDPQPMIDNGDAFYFDVPVGDIQQTGEVPLRVILTTGVDYYGMIRRTRTMTPEQVGMIIVPMPSWATNSGLTFTPDPQESHVIYRATTNIPETPIETPIIEIPDVIPYIGGQWGLSPVQMIVNIGATSLGGPQTESIGGTGTLYFAGDEYDLEFDGTFVTNMTADQLEVLESPFTIALSEPVTFTRKLPLLTIVPGVAALYAIPYVGDLVASLSSVASVTATITANVTGQGTLGITPNDELGITSGAVNYQLNGSVNAGFTPAWLPAWLYVNGTILGNVHMSLAPQAAITDCNLSSSFTVVAGAAGIGTYTLAEVTPPGLALCS